MNFTNEMIEKAKKAKSADELLEMAKAEGVELSASEAEQYYAFLSGCRELTDEELQQVAGGKGFAPTEAYTFLNGDCFLYGDFQIWVYTGTAITCLAGTILEFGFYGRAGNSAVFNYCGNVKVAAYAAAHSIYLGNRSECPYTLVD